MCFIVIVRLCNFSYRHVPDPRVVIGGMLVGNSNGIVCQQAVNMLCLYCFSNMSTLHVQVRCATRLLQVLYCSHDITIAINCYNL